jgi:hypothetical protein
MYRFRSPLIRKVGEFSDGLLGSAIGFHGTRGNSPAADSELMNARREPPFRIEDKKGALTATPG